MPRAEWWVRFGIGTVMVLIILVGTGLLHGPHPSLAGTWTDLDHNSVLYIFHQDGTYTITGLDNSDPNISNHTYRWVDSEHLQFDQAVYQALLQGDELTLF